MQKGVGRQCLPAHAILSVGSPLTALTGRFPDNRISASSVRYAGNGALDVGSSMSFDAVSLFLFAIAVIELSACCTRQGREGRPATAWMGANHACDATSRDRTSKRTPDRRGMAGLCEN